MQLDQDSPAALTELANRHGWIPRDAVITNLSVAGDGNMNCVLRGQVSNGTSLVFKQSLPFVAKYPQIDAPVERLDFEAAFYEITSSVDAIARQMPHVIGYDAESRVMCLEDLGESSDFVDIYQGQGHSGDVETAISDVLDWLSNLHAVRLSVAQESGLQNAAMRQLNHQHIFLIPVQAGNGLALDPLLMGFADQLRKSRTAMQRIGELGDAYLGERPHDSRTCLLHGDYYPGSWLRHQNSRVMVIDPEFCFAGPPEFDVGVLIAHLTFASFDPSVISEILRGYATPAGFSWEMARRFAAVEVIRRLLGVAQLSLDANIQTKLQWLREAQAELEAS